MARSRSASETYPNLTEESSWAAGLAAWELQEIPHGYRTNPEDVQELNKYTMTTMAMGRTMKFIVSEKSFFPKVYVPSNATTTARYAITKPPKGRNSGPAIHKQCGFPI